MTTPTKFRVGIDLNNQRGTNFADPTSNTDAATKQYVDAKAAGLEWKQAVRAATTTNGTLATAYANAQVIDGVTLATNDRILLKNQTTQTENGIYVVNGAGAPTRATDADATLELNDATVFVIEGTTLKGTAWTQTTLNPTVGTNNIVFAQFGAGTGITAGNGLTGTSTISVLLDTSGLGSGLSVSGSGLKVDYSKVGGKFAANCVVTTNPQTFTHGLGTDDVDVSVWDSAGNQVFPGVSKGSGTVIVDWGSAPAASDYRIVIQG